MIETLRSITIEHRRGSYLKVGTPKWFVRVHYMRGRVSVSAILPHFKSLTIVNTKHP